MSSLKHSTVIVFGPTGEVGGSAALEAAKRGAKVYLAMRDPSKNIPGIPQSDEKSLSFERIKADLTDPASVTSVIKQSGAKAAYIYRVQSADHLLSSLTAMKAAGIEYIVFLSSFSLEPESNIRAVQPMEIIPYIHAQIEITLEDLGIPHVALRPAQFASNGFKMNLDKSKSPWQVNMLYGDYTGDAISPIDIGRVGGAVLVDPPANVMAKGKEVIFLCGPKLLTSDQQWEIVKKVSGKDIKVKHCTEQEYKDYITGLGFPFPIVEYLVKSMPKMKPELYVEPFYSESVANIKRYSGHEPTQFEDYVKEYKSE
ncbi:hypothetical protein H2198_003375 [Neophaeococcomyces mojaviensis]|uniref:Uncharacterized protein n=1 Tax=Neophaeococcomyces mojaviensis TaxID=3383035 RepID=A0ACC3ABF3_9EURO|nr:hypothetical protein H2198_003375 [Knufia sp. JES_112]